jgi:hypothetical protein
VIVPDELGITLIPVMDPDAECDEDYHWEAKDETGRAVKGQELVDFLIGVLSSLRQEGVW